MRFYLQQGWGMMALNLEYVEKNPGTGVILSPRSLNPDQIQSHAEELHEIGAPVLFDPQFYKPRTERENIIKYPYWRDAASFSTRAFAKSGAKDLCKGVIEYQCNVLDVETVILPGRYTNAATEEWRETQHMFAETAGSFEADRPIFSTLALGPDVVSESENFDKVLNEAILYPVDGYYIVLAPPRKQFLVEDTVYLYNALDGLLSLALSGKQVLVGYANQQSLVYAAAGVTGLASGNFRNVRSFDPDIFDKRDEGGGGRSIWYYDPRTLSEYKPQQLALAYRRGLKDRFGPTCEYCKPLLSSASPANVPWPEPQPFKHFLTHLRQQWLALERMTVASRGRAIVKVLQDVRERLEEYEEQGFSLGDRAFDEALEPTLSAIKGFTKDRAADIEDLN